MSPTSSNLARLFLAALCTSCGGASSVHPKNGVHPSAQETREGDSKVSTVQLQPGCREHAAELELSKLVVPADARCVVRDERGQVERVVVRTGASDQIALRVSNALVVLTPTATGAVHVRVDGSLRFEGWTRVASYAFSASNETIADVLKPGSAVRLSAPQLQDDHVRGTLQLERMRVLDFDAPCSALATARESEAPVTLSLHSPLLRPVEARIALFKEPRDASPTFQVEGLAATTQGESAAAFVHIATAFSDGTRIAGWALRSALEPIPSGEEPVPAGRGLALCGTGCGGGDTPGDIVGEAELQVDAPVHTAPGGPVWATVSRPLRAEVVRRAGQPWISLLRVPGVMEDIGCETLVHAFVEERYLRSFAPKGR